VIYDNVLPPIFQVKGPKRIGALYVTCQLFKIYFRVTLCTSVIGFVHAACYTHYVENMYTNFVKNILYEYLKIMCALVH
jgi:hypothetical protein